MCEREEDTSVTLMPLKNTKQGLVKIILSVTYIEQIISLYTHHTEKPYDLCNGDVSIILKYIIVHPQFTEVFL
jgi:hypothetical protein